MSTLALLGLSALSPVLACPGHDGHLHGALNKRIMAGQTDWAYESSFNWGMINPDYTLCQTGTMQSPIMLSLTQGITSNHIMTFNYPDSVEGEFHNWGYGPAFDISMEEGNYTGNPSFNFDNEILYLVGWHIHAPADHTVEGGRSKAEIHFVHADSTGHERAVIAVRVDPGLSGSAPSPFFAQLPAMIGFNDTTTRTTINMNPRMAIAEVNGLDKYWTYYGSLTSPPCTEGIRWFVSRDIMFTDVKQMQDILAVSTYSARVEQKIWEHYLENEGA